MEPAFVSGISDLKGATCSFYLVRIQQGAMFESESLHQTPNLPAPWSYISQSPEL
jgi:hypothetical protein